MGKEQTPPPPSTPAEKSKSNRPAPPSPSSHHGNSGHSSAKPPPAAKPAPFSVHSRPPVPSTADKNKHSNRPTPSSYHYQQPKKKATMSIRISKKGHSAGGGSKIGTCSKTGLILVTASMPEVGIVPPPSDERDPQFCCVWPTETDCRLVVEDTTINGVSCQVLKNTGGGGGDKEDLERSCLLLPLLE